MPAPRKHQRPCAVHAFANAGAYKQVAIPRDDLIPDTGEAPNEQISLNADDLEAALRLLKTEGRAAQVDLRTATANLLLLLSFAVVLVAGPLGFLTVWFSAS